MTGLGSGTGADMGPDGEDDSVLDRFSLNAYEVPIQLVLSEFDTYAELELTIRETVAKSIATHVDSLGDGDVSYISTKVGFDREELENIFENGDAEFVELETTTQLGIIND